MRIQNMRKLAPCENFPLYGISSRVETAVHVWFLCSIKSMCLLQELGDMQECNLLHQASTWVYHLSSTCAHTILPQNHTIYTYMVYHISLQCRRTSKSRCPRNVPAYFCPLIPINVALKISPHGKGSTALDVCTRTLYINVQTGLLSKPWTHVSISVDTALNIAALKLLPHQMGPWNKISPWRDFEEIQYSSSQ